MKFIYKHIITGEIRQFDYIDTLTRLSITKIWKRLPELKEETKLQDLVETDIKLTDLSKPEATIKVRKKRGKNSEQHINNISG
jgi:hypothetical protein